MLTKTFLTGIKTALALALTGSTCLFAQQESIYNPDTPRVVNIWHRVADYAPTLRSVESAAISRDGRYVVSGAKFGYAVMLWRVADGALLWEKAHDSEVECVAFSPDGTKIATGGEDFFLRIWDTQTGKELYAMEQSGALDGVAWSNNGQIIASGTEDGEITMWDAKTYRPGRKTKVGSTINSIQFSKDDTKVVVGGNIKYNDPKTGKRAEDGFAKLLRVADLQTLVAYEGTVGSVKSIRISPDEQFIATGGFDHKVRLYEMNTGKQLRVFEEPVRVEAVAFTIDNKYLLSGGHDHKIRFYRLNDFKEVFTLETPRTEYIDFCEDGRLFVTAHEDSGLLSLYLMVSESHRIPGLYNKLSKEQLKNRDLDK